MRGQNRLVTIFATPSMACSNYVGENGKDFLKFNESVSFFHLQRQLRLNLIESPNSPQPIIPPCSSYSSQWLISLSFLSCFSRTVFACLGFLSPANRGALMTCAMVLYVCLGTPAGFVSARVYKSFGGDKWKSNVLLTSMLTPG